MAGVQWYGWAPKGFVHEYKWNQTLVVTFLPLYALDEKVWHQGIHISEETKYPVDEVPFKDTWKVYVAWGLMHPTKKNPN